MIEARYSVIRSALLVLFFGVGTRSFWLRSALCIRKSGVAKDEGSSLILLVGSRLHRVTAGRGSIVTIGND